MRGEATTASANVRRHGMVVPEHEGQGCVLCSTSDPAPHWGGNMVFWDRYAEFWLRCLELATPQA